MKYRKKPVVIEAFQMTEERRYDNSEWPNWLNEAWNAPEETEGALYIDPSDGKDRHKLMLWHNGAALPLAWGDWIIRGVKGELYPCKPDVFAASYEPAE